MKRSRTFFLLTALALVATGSSLPAGAAPPPSATATTVTAVPEQESSGLLPVGTLSLSWIAGSNLNQRSRPRAYNHTMDLGYSATLFEKVEGSASVGAAFSTINGDVYRQSNTSAYYEIDDIALGLRRSFKLTDRQSMSTSLTENILTSETSRYLGYRSVTSGSVNHGVKALKWLNVGQGLSGTYILNRYRYATAAPSGPGSRGLQTGDVNPELLLTYSIGPSITLWKKLTLGAQMSFGTTKYLDNTYIYNFGNSYQVSYSEGRWSVFARYRNRGYAERGESNLWFVDPYRRLASAGLSVSF